jgi:oxygen-dependent protoporphyrinogen oxidase
MNFINRDSPPLVVIGGGISGLAAAHRFVELASGCPLRLLEAGQRIGGMLQSNSEEGFLWESAADGFHASADVAWSLCQRIGLADEIVYASPCDEPLQLVHRGKLTPAPAAILSGMPPTARALVSTPLLSARGKVRILAERWIGPNLAEDESCASFFGRRFGREFYERLVEPVLGGIYLADPACLSMQALFPRLRAMEQQAGSLTAAFRLQSQHVLEDRIATEKHRSAWTLRGGLSRLTATLAGRLPTDTIQLNAPVHRLRRADNRSWQIEYGHGRTMEAAGVVLATPAHQAARLLAAINREAARLLEHISYSSVAVIALAYRQAQIGERLTSFGFFVPGTAACELRSATFSSLKYVGRAPADAVLIRASLGGEHHTTIIDHSDTELIQLADQELSRLLKINGGPVFARVRRHLFALPQYRPMHGELIAAVGRQLADLRGLTLAGNAYTGMGVPQCIASGCQAADEILTWLDQIPGSASCQFDRAALPAHTEPAHA